MTKSYNKLFLKNKIEDFQKGKQKESFEELKDYLIQYPEDTLARYNFGLMAQTLGLINEAKKQYTITIDKDKRFKVSKFKLFVSSIISIINKGLGYLRIKPIYIGSTSQRL